MAMRCLAALAAGFCRKRMAHGKATLAWIYAPATFTARFGGKLMVLRKTPFFIGDALSTLTRDCPLLFRVH